MSKLVELDATSLAVLSKHKHYFDLFMKTGELVNFTHEVQNDILAVYQKAAPGYTYNRGCGACVGAFLFLVYKTFNDQLAL